MATEKHEPQSNFAKMFFQRGREEGREEPLERIFSTHDHATLKRWLRQAITVKSLDTMFD